MHIRDIYKKCINSFIVFYITVTKTVFYLRNKLVICGILRYNELNINSGLYLKKILCLYIVLTKSPIL